MNWEVYISLSFKDRMHIAVGSDLSRETRDVKDKC